MSSDDDDGAATGQTNGKGEKAPKVPKPMSKLEAFRQLTPKLRQGYGQSATLSRLADVCWSDSLIRETIHDLVIDTNNEGEPRRAVVLLKRVYKKDKESIAHLKTFAKIIRDVDSCQSHSEAAQKIDACKTAKDFKSQITDIADSLQASVTRIADHAMAQSLISYPEYLLVADSSAKHSERCTLALFQALDETFQGNPSLIDKFFNVTIKKTDDISNFAGQYKNLIGKP